MNDVRSTDNAFFGLMSVPYGAAVAVRNAMFDGGLRKVHRLGRPVVSIGNLTTGGTGKTPMVAHLARRLMNGDHSPAVLTRGYKAVNGVSDEASLLADELGSSVPVEVNADRAAGARAVLAKRPDVTVFLLDDGFQHRRVHRDVDLVLIDASHPFGGDHLLPRGRLREPVVGLRRADGVIVTRCDQVGPEALATLDQRIASIHGRPPIAHATHRWEGFRDATGTSLPLDTLAGTPTVGICGIGNPHGFEASLREHTDLRHLAAFPDHHDYTDLQALIAAIEQGKVAGAKGVVTTEKDWVKWRRRSVNLGLPIYRPILRMTLLDGEAGLDELLERIEPPSRQGRQEEEET